MLVTENTHSCTIIGKANPKDYPMAKGK